MANLTPFQRRVYACTKLIPEGCVSTYKLIAVAIGEPNSSRAVGTALKKNPFPDFVPCHRVINSDRKVGGYFGSTDDKAANLKKVRLIAEGICFRGNKVLDDPIQVIFNPTPEDLTDDSLTNHGILAEAKVLPATTDEVAD